MFVYVAEFEGRPGLIKIGVAENVAERMSQLKRSHGTTVEVCQYDVGGDRYAVERFIHRVYKASNIRLLDKCDGYTEFFHVDSKPGIEKLLDSIAKALPVNVIPAPMPLVALAGKPTDIFGTVVYEKFLADERVLNCQTALALQRVERLRVDDFIMSVIFRGKDVGIKSFVRKDWTVFNTLWEAVNYGVSMDHVLKAMNNFLVEFCNKPLTKWKVTVLAAAVFDRTSRFTKNKVRIETWQTRKDAERVYATMVANGEVVDDSFVDKLPAATTNLYWKEYCGHTFELGDLTKLLRVRELQVPRPCATGRPVLMSEAVVKAWRKSYGASIATTAKHWNLSESTVKRYCAKEV